MPTKSPHAGFTLIELSIVLVIIGLIVGGVLVGRNLIKASEIRATIAQVEKYNSAVNTFKGKYGELPGDITSANAASFGFVTRAGSLYRGDGNGMIGAANCQSETVLFWNDLSKANLVDGNFVGADSVLPPSVTSATQWATYAPLARLGKGNYFTVSSYLGINYFHIAGIYGNESGAGYNLTMNISPLDMYAIDTKLDDGAPLAGIVRATGAAAMDITPVITAPSASVSAASGYCVVGDAVGTNPADTYNRGATTGGEVPSCAAQFRFN